MEKTNGQLAMRVSVKAIIANCALSAIKLFAGIFGNSAAMISDSVHSMSDVLSSVIVIIGLRLSNKKSDREHQYGHERLECVAAIILSALIAGTGLMIGWNGVQKMIAGDYAETGIPGITALLAAGFSIAVKEALYWYTRAAAKKINSGVLMADAWHHRSDSLSSGGSLAAVFGSRIGFPILDPAACVIICLFILKAAYNIFCDSVGKLTDKACDDAFVEELRVNILKNGGDFEIDQIKTRIFGDKIYVDLEININGGISLTEAHDTAQRVHDSIEEEFPTVKHCMVHVNPSESGESEGL